MSERSPFRDIVEDLARDHGAVSVSRLYFYLFLTCYVLGAYLQRSAAGWGFVVVLVAGTFAVPLLIAAPLMHLKKVLGAKGVLRPHNPAGWIHPRFIDVSGGVAICVGTWGALRALGG